MNTLLFGKGLRKGKGDRTVNANVKDLQKSGMKRSDAIRSALEHGKHDAKLTDKNVKEAQSRRSER